MYRKLNACKFCLKVALACKLHKVVFHGPDSSGSSDAFVSIPFSPPLPRHRNRSHLCHALPLRLGAVVRGGTRKETTIGAFFFFSAEGFCLSAFSDDACLSDDPFCEDFFGISSFFFLWGGGGGGGGGEAQSADEARKATKEARSQRGKKRQAERESKKEG